MMPGRLEEQPTSYTVRYADLRGLVGIACYLRRINPRLIDEINEFQDLLKNKQDCTISAERHSKLEQLKDAIHTSARELHDSYFDSLDR